MDRLVDMEYGIVHRGGRGQTFTYELLYHGKGADGDSFIDGLITPNLNNGGNLAGVKAQVAGPKRPQNGSKTGGMRCEESGYKPEDNWDIEELIAESVENDGLEKNKKTPAMARS